MTHAIKINMSNPGPKGYCAADFDGVNVIVRVPQGVRITHITDAFAKAIVTKSSKNVVGEPDVRDILDGAGRPTGDKCLYGHAAAARVEINIG